MIYKTALYTVNFAANLALLQGISCLFKVVPLKQKLRDFLIFILLGVLLFQLLAIVTDYMFIVPETILFHNTVLFLLCYFLMISLADQLLPGFFKYKHVFFAFLLATSLFNDAIILFMQRDDKIALLYSLVASNTGVQIFIMKALFAISGIVITLAFVLIVIKAAAAWKEREYTAVVAITIGFALCTIVAIVLILAGYLLPLKPVLLVGMTIISTAIMVNMLIVTRYPEFMNILEIEVEKTGYTKSVLTGLDINEKLHQLLRIMPESRPYLDEECSLKELALELDVTPHQLSELINDHLGINFNTFINRYRITEAQQMLIEEKDRSILSVAYAVGFSSKSAFYESFSKISGLTPKQYRDTHKLR